jgi:hypothetical protein
MTFEHRKLQERARLALAASTDLEGREISVARTICRLYLKHRGPRRNIEVAPISAIRNAVMYLERMVKENKQCKHSM